MLRNIFQYRGKRSGDFQQYKSGLIYHSCHFLSFVLTIRRQNCVGLLSKILVLASRIRGEEWQSIYESCETVWVMLSPSISHLDERGGERRHSGHILHTLRACNNNKFLLNGRLERQTSVSLQMLSINIMLGIGQCRDGQCIIYIRLDTTFLLEWLHPWIYRSH